MKNKRSRRGLTLIEVVVVITITAMLMSAVGVYALGSLREARIKSSKMDVQSALNALDMYLAAKGTYPDPGEGFAPVIKIRALKKEPKDAWGNALIWELREGEAIVTSLGADGVKGGAEDDADLSSAD